MVFMDKMYTHYLLSSIEDDFNLLDNEIFLFETSKMTKNISRYLVDIIIYIFMVYWKKWFNFKLHWKGII